MNPARGQQPSLTAFLPENTATRPDTATQHVIGTTIHHGVLRGHVVAAVQILRSRLAEPWTLDALADEVHLSRSQLVRAFDATVGTSPMAYLRKMRAERMARLLATTDLSVAEAGRTVGWKDPNYASATFHDHHGISATEYRRRQGAPPIG